MVGYGGSIIPLGSKPGIYYHITKRENLPSILKEGLVPRAGGGLLDLRYEVVRKAIYLAETPGLAEEQADWESSEDWVLLKIILPKSYEDSIKEDEYGYLFTQKPIPSRYIEVIK